MRRLVSDAPAFEIHGLPLVEPARPGPHVEHRARFENHYIDNWSLLTDLTILLRAVPSLVRR